MDGMGRVWGRLRLWVERRNAAWVADACRSASLTSRSENAKLPHVATTILLLLAFILAVAAFALAPAATAQGVAILAALTVAIVGFSAWRLIAECLPTVSVAQYMVVTGASLDETPADEQVRAREVQEEWTRRLGERAALSHRELARRVRMQKAIALISFSILCILLTALYALAHSGMTYAWLALAVVLLVVQKRVASYLKEAVETYQADLRKVFGEPLPPGPPGDPHRFESWREEAEAPHSANP